MSSPQSPLSGFTPMQTFVIGIIGGILVLCTIGFFVMLGLYFGDDAPSTSRQGTGTQPTVVEQPTVEQPTAANISFRPVQEDIDAGRDNVRGAEDPKVTIIEYSDFECPFCKRFHETMLQIMANYGDDVQWVYRHFPLQMHAQAPAQAVAAECAGEQGRFAQFADIIFANTQGNDTLDMTQIEAYARQAGVADIAAFNTCREENRYQDRVTADMADGRSAGLQGTPHSLIIGPDGEARPVSGALPYASVEQLLLPYLN